MASSNNHIPHFVDVEYPFTGEIVRNYCGSWELYQFAYTLVK